MTSAPHLPQKKRRELTNNNLDGSVEQGHEHHQWRPFGKLRFVDAYREVKAHFLIRFSLGNSQEFIACFQRDWRKDVFKDDLWKSLFRRRDEHFWDATCQRVFLSWSEAASWIYKARGQEQSMFVDDIELVEVPQEPISSLVWLDTVENFESILTYGWYNSITDGFVVFGRISDWELRVGSDDWDKPAREVIKSATKAMENISKDQWNLRANGWDRSDVVANVSRIRIKFTHSGNGISIEKGLSSRIQFLDVLFGPIQLG